MYLRKAAGATHCHWAVAEGRSLGPASKYRILDNLFATKVLCAYASRGTIFNQSRMRIRNSWFGASTRVALQFQLYLELQFNP